MKTRKNVEIARIGEYELSTGTHKFTKAQLAAAIENANNGFAPVIGIGHTDPRWQHLAATDADGEPSLGRVDNLRLAEDGEVLLGDYTNLPDWFADALPTAFARRSLEGSCDGDDLRITAVKVLGMTKPGIHTLADLKELVSDEGPALIAAGADNDGHEITVILATDAATELRASANIEDLREAWQADHPSNWDAEPPVVWMIEEIQVDPDQLIYRHEEKTFRQPWAVDGDGNFTFGDPVEVTKQYVDKVAASGPAAVYMPPKGGPTNQEASTMDPKAMRKALGLPEDATDEQVRAKFAETFAEADKHPGETTPAKPAVESHPEGEPKDPEKEPLNPEEKADPAIPEGMALVDKEALATLQASAGRADELYEERRVRERDGLLDAAQGEGRFPRARRDHYKTMFDTDPDGTRKLLTASAADGGLAPGLVPVDNPRGRVAASGEDSATSDLLEKTRRALHIKTPTEG